MHYCYTEYQKCEISILEKLNTYSTKDKNLIDVKLVLCATFEYQRAEEMNTQIYHKDIKNNTTTEINAKLYQKSARDENSRISKVTTDSP